MLGSFDAGEFSLARVLAAKRATTVSVCVPARDEAATIGEVVDVLAELAAAGIVDEIVVIDDGSNDDTAAIAREHGATVHPSAAVLPGFPPGPGKGEAMWRGVYVTSGDIVAFCDADVREFGAGFILGLVGPLLENAAIGLVKGHYRRGYEGQPGEGGRVTELLARPLVAALFPHLLPIVQPLAGECALRREVLESVPFAGGYAVDLGLLVDVSALWGVEVIAQCDLGERLHRNRPLTELGPQALAILQLALERAGVEPARHKQGAPGNERWTSVLTRPGAADADVTLRTLPPLRHLDADLRPA